MTKIARDSRGAVALEAVLVTPVLLVLLCGLVDFSLAFCYKGMLASSVAEGMQFSMLTGPGVSSSDIKAIVRQRLSLPVSDVAVTGPSCYCVSGTPATAVAQSCTRSCPDGTTPGTYVTISAQYTYNSILPFYSQLSGAVITETAKARLK